MKPIARRAFVKKTALAAGCLPWIPAAVPDFWQHGTDSPGLEMHLFSKHLQFLSCTEAAEVAAQLGFSGLDLTVRPGGHVEPENVKVALPKALEAIGRGGSRCQLMTTAVGSADNPIDRDVLETSAANGVTMYRSDWFRYDRTLGMKASLAHFRGQVARLSQLNKQLGLVGCYQNHAGSLIGASAWEVDELLEDADRQSFGVQYDIRHATLEGGLSWENGLHLLRSHIKSVVLKDFKWEQVNGSYQVVNTPIGEGMVDFARFFKLLKAYRIRVPVILHLEYPLGGAEHGARKLEIDKGLVFDAMKNDLKTIKDLWANT